MPENIVYVCRDCQQPMDVQHQSDGQGAYVTLITCWCLSCLLNAVTLNVDQYAQLTETQLKAYRKMNRTSRSKYLGAA
jgi:hypothetical protein